MKPFSQVAILAIAIRVVLIVYGEWQDRHLEVKYTDVDYWVFSDAAHALAAGRSPFTRSTYRYTPLLAVLLLPNVFLTSVWGKILFSASDILTGRLVYLFLLRVTNSVRAAKLSAIFILLNPMTFTISTRGNAESILSSIILASLYFCTSGRYMLGGLLYGVAVHLKLFPIIYGVAIFCYLWSGKLRRSIDVPPLSPRKELSPSPSPSPVSSNESSPNRIKNRRKTKNRDQNSPRLSAMSSPKKITSVSVTTRKMRIWSIFIFGLFSALSFGLLTFLSYWKYGGDYLNEAIIYHLSRKDHRHNFSPYFYLFYTESFLSLPKYSELAAFVPQVLFFVLAGVKFGKKDLPFSLFIITFVFVTFNKVITSQYFIWYLSLFPVAYVSLHNISPRRWAFISLLWFGSQAAWLHFAYKLEFLGENTFAAIWAASIVFLIVNVWIAGQFIRHRFVPEILHAGPGIITLNNMAL